jgi:hypothetical protein
MLWRRRARAGYDDLYWELRLRERRTMTPADFPDDHSTDLPAVDHPPASVRINPLPAAIPPTDLDPPIRLEPPTPPPPVSFRGIVKQSLTKKSRNDLGQRMVEMCTLTGWQGTTLNPDMGDDAKMVILSSVFGKLAAEDDPDELYRELVALAGVTMGWAQGIARREMRERKRRERQRKRERKRDRQARKAKAKRTAKKAKDG